jgi:hypothetical protein
MNKDDILLEYYKMLLEYYKHDDSYYMNVLNFLLLSNSIFISAFVVLIGSFIQSIIVIISVAAIIFSFIFLLAFIRVKWLRDTRVELAEKVEAYFDKTYFEGNPTIELWSILKRKKGEKLIARISTSRVFSIFAIILIVFWMIVFISALFFPNIWAP